MMHAAGHFSTPDVTICSDASLGQLLDTVAVAESLGNQADRSQGAGAHNTRHGSVGASTESISQC